MKIICPVCDRQQDKTTGEWHPVDHDNQGLPNYFMCRDCYEEGRKSYREEVSRIVNGKYV